MRTSVTHPIQIAAVSTGLDMGRIGVTFCPGKRQPHAATGGWDRQLDLDLAAIAAWGAVAIVTLVEPAELIDLGVANLGAEVSKRHVDCCICPFMIFRHRPPPLKHNGRSPARRCAAGCGRGSIFCRIARAASGGRV